MGFFGNILSAAVKTAVTPIAIAKDVVNTVTGEEIDSTKNHMDSISKDIDEAFDDIT